MKAKVLSIGLSVLACLSGCTIHPQRVTYTVRDNVAEVDKALNTWIGRAEFDIIKHFGTPDNSYTDGSRNSTIRYYGKTIRTSTGIAIGNYASISSTSHTYYIDFLFNNNGRVVSQRNNYPKTYASTEYSRMQTMQEAKDSLYINLLKLGGIAAAIIVAVIVLR